MYGAVERWAVVKHKPGAGLVFHSSHESGAYLVVTDNAIVTVGHRHHRVWRH
jgi:hypothetical protein